MSFTVDQGPGQWGLCPDMMPLRAGPVGSRSPRDPLPHPTPTPSAGTTVPASPESKLRLPARARLGGLGVRGVIWASGGRPWPLGAGRPGPGALHRPTAGSCRRGGTSAPPSPPLVTAPADSRLARTNGGWGAAAPPTCLQPGREGRPRGDGLGWGGTAATTPRQRHASVHTPTPGRRPRDHPVAAEAAAP